MDFDEIVELEGWDDLVVIQILRSFISQEGLSDELDRFASEWVIDENDLDLEEQE